jgi:hypothetical protein
MTNWLWPNMNFRTNLFPTKNISITCYINTTLNTWLEILIQHNLMLTSQLHIYSRALVWVARGVRSGNYGKCTSRRTMSITQYCGIKYLHQDNWVLFLEMNMSSRVVLQRCLGLFYSYQNVLDIFIKFHWD